MFLTYQAIVLFWTFASTVHRLTPYPNLNGVITSLAIPLIAFPISARWEKIVRGEVGVFAEFGRIATIVYSTMVIVGLSLSIWLLLKEFHLDLTFVSWLFLTLPIAWLLLILPIAASTLLRFFATVDIIIGLVVLLMFMPYAIEIAWFIIRFIIDFTIYSINAIGIWLFSKS
jgi:hypothetical protein